jgi:cysteinyl-tRNA synthetase
LCHHAALCRTYVVFDVLRRILRDYFSYDVILTMNITDIDDKIILRSKEAGVPFESLTRKFEAEFLGDMEKLGVAPPDVLTRVSEVSAAS